MAHLDVETAVKARIKERFTGGPEIFDEGRFTVPSNGAPFIVLQFPFNENWQRTIDGPNGRHFTEEGGFRFVISVRRKGKPEENVQAGKQWAQQIADIFRGAEFDGVRCFAPSSPTGDNTNDEGGYYVLTLVVEYEFTFLQQE